MEKKVSKKVKRLLIISSLLVCMVLSSVLVYAADITTNDDYFWAGSSRIHVEMGMPQNRAWIDVSSTDECCFRINCVAKAPNGVEKPLQASANDATVCGASTYLITAQNYFFVISGNVTAIAEDGTATATIYYYESIQGGVGR